MVANTERGSYRNIVIEKIQANTYVRIRIFCYWQCSALLFQLFCLRFSFVFVILIGRKGAGPMYRFHSILESLSHRSFVFHARICQDDHNGKLATAMDKAIRAVVTDLHELHQSVWRFGNDSAHG